MGVSGYSGGAIVMPMWKRTAITAVQLFMTLITAGVIIGYGQLYPILVDMDVYHDRCPDNWPHKNVCPQQASALDQLFIYGASISIFIQAPSGVILDFLGPRITCWAGLVLFIPGCFIFAFAPHLKAIDAYMLGFQLLAAGGPFVFLSTMPVAQLWPDKKAMILMMVNGLYGGGAFVFFLFLVLYKAGVSWFTLFFAYGILGCSIAVVAFFVWPRRSFAETASINNDDVAVPKLSNAELLSKSLKDMATWDFVFVALVVSFLVFKSNYFLSTYPQQWGLYLSPSEASRFSDIFGIALPLIGIFAGPIGLIFDKFGENIAFIFLILLSSLSSMCGLMIWDHYFAPFQVVRMLVFSLYFPMIYGVWAFYVIAKFGTLNFGVLYGVVAVLAGIVNVFASNPLTEFALRQNSFVWANILLLSIGGVFVIYPIVSVVAEKVKGARRDGYYAPIH